MDKMKQNGVWLGRRGAFLVEASLVMLIILVPLFFLQMEILAQMRRNLKELQKERLVYDGRRSP